MSEKNNVNKPMGVCITFNWETGKPELWSIFKGPNADIEVDTFMASVKDDFPHPKYSTIKIRNELAKKLTMKRLGLSDL